MGFLVVNGCQLMCSFGTAPSAMMVTPANKVLATSPAANIMDYKPNVNIMPFAMCTSMANPAVASATSAAMGVLTPQPCTPMTAAPWAPGAPTVLIANMPALNDSSKLICSYGGTISVIAPAQTQTLVP